MRKFLFFVIAFLCLGTIFGQEEVFVSTTPGNKNVVIENYTGMHCQYCPYAHQEAMQLKNADPTRVNVIIIHAGDYAVPSGNEPNYQTEFGSSLLNQIGCTEFPSGTVNRHLFSGTRLEVNYDKWATRSNTIKNQQSYCNIAARSTLDPATRELSVHVQVYFTRSGAPSTMKLNLALIQDSILGPQTAMSNNPSQVIGSQYCHMAMLRHLLTGQWGCTVTNTTEGSLIDTVITYTVPLAINDVDVVLKNLSVVAFIAESKKEIITGCTSEMTMLEQPEISAKPFGLAIYDVAGCSRKADITLYNGGSTTINSITGTCEINGIVQDINYNGTIEPLSIVKYTTDAWDLPANTEMPVTITLNSCNGQDIHEEYTQNYQYYAATGTIKIKIKADKYSGQYTLNGSTHNGEQSWKLYDPNGTVIESKTQADFTSNIINTFTVSVSGAPGCYRLLIKDSYGDGISGGYYKIVDSQNHEIIYGSGDFTSSANAYFYWDGATAITDFEEVDDIVIYPNPASDKLNIVSENPVKTVQIFNLQGQLVQTAHHANEVEVSHLSAGMYICRITTDKGITAIKFNKK